MQREKPRPFNTPRAPAGPGADILDPCPPGASRGKVLIFTGPRPVPPPETPLFASFRLPSGGAEIRRKSDASKTSQSRPRGAHGSIFMSFWLQSDSHFLCLFGKCPNLVFCNKYRAKYLFLLPKVSHFGIKNQSTNYVFSRHLLGHHFFVFYVEF